MSRSLIAPTFYPLPYVLDHPELLVEVLPHLTTARESATGRRPPNSLGCACYICDRDWREKGDRVPAAYLKIVVSSWPDRALAGLVCRRCWVLPRDELDRRLFERIRVDLKVPDAEVVPDSSFAPGGRA